MIAQSTSRKITGGRVVADPVLEVVGVHLGFLGRKVTTVVGVGEVGAASTRVDVTDMGFSSGRIWREHLERGAGDVKENRAPTSPGYVDNVLFGGAAVVRAFRSSGDTRRSWVRASVAWVVRCHA